MRHIAINLGGREGLGRIIDQLIDVAGDFASYSYGTTDLIDVAGEITPHSHRAVFDAQLAGVALNRHITANVKVSNHSRRTEYGFRLEIVGELAHYVDACQGLAAGNQSYLAATDDVDCEGLAAREGRITGNRLAAVGQHIDILADEDVLTSRYFRAGGNRHITLYRSVGGERRKIAATIQCVVRAGGDGAKDTDNIDRGAIVDHNAVRVEDVDVSRIGAIKGTFNRRSTTTARDDIVERGCGVRSLAKFHPCTVWDVHLYPVQETDRRSGGQINAEQCGIGSARGRIAIHHGNGNI